MDQVLTNPKYIGCNVWGRTAQKLHSSGVRNPIEKRVVKPQAFSPIIDERVFNRVQKICRDRTNNKTNAEILQKLRRLLVKEGRLSEQLIDSARSVPALSNGRAVIVVPSQHDVTSLAIPVQQVVQSLDKNLPVAYVLTLNQLIGASTIEASFTSTLILVRPLDIPIFVAVAVVLTLVASVSCLMPAWHASRLDPMRALRVE